MNPCILVGEVGLNHAGDVRLAKAIIGMCKAFGLDSVKFQKRSPTLVYRRAVQNEPRLSHFGSRQIHEKLALEFGKEEYDEIDAFCRILQIPWFASPWDIPSLEFLMRYECPYVKIASACLLHDKLVDAIVEAKRPIVASFGALRGQPEDMVERLNRHGKLAHVLFAVPEYPTRDEHVNLKGFLSLKQRLEGMNVGVGYSNHSPRCIYAAAAYILGASMIEAHVTLAKSFGGGDQSSSFHPGALLKLREHLDALVSAWGTGATGLSQSVLAKLNQYVWMDTGGAA